MTALKNFESQLQKIKWGKKQRHSPKKFLNFLIDAKTKPQNRKKSSVKHIRRVPTKF